MQKVTEDRFIYIYEKEIIHVVWLDPNSWLSCLSLQVGITGVCHRAQLPAILKRNNILNMILAIEIQNKCPKAYRYCQGEMYIVSNLFFQQHSYIICFQKAGSIRCQFVKTESLPSCLCDLACVEVCRLGDKLRCHFSGSICLKFLRSGLGLAEQGRLTGQRPQRSCCLYLLSTGISSMNQHTQPSLPLPSVSSGDWQALSQPRCPSSRSHSLVLGGLLLFVLSVSI